MARGEVPANHQLVCHIVEGNKRAIESEAGNHQRQSVGTLGMGGGDNWSGEWSGEWDVCWVSGDGVLHVMMVMW